MKENHLNMFYYIPNIAQHSFVFKTSFNIMKHIIVLILGYASGILTTFAGIPQVIKIIRTSSTQDLSYIGLAMTTSGLCLWTVYGFLENDNPMIVFNMLAFFIYCALFSLKIYIEIYKKKLSDSPTNITYSQLSTLQDGESV